MDSYCLFSESKPSTPEEPIETFTLYPNPADKTIIVQCDGEREGTLQFRMFNAAGKLMTQQSIDLMMEGVGISVKNIIPGIYFGELRQNGILIGGKRIAIYR